MYSFLYSGARCVTSMDWLRISQCTRMLCARLGQGRTFDGQILDMVEFHVEELRTMTQVSAASKRYASKPCLLFVGEPWEADAVFRPLRNLLLGERETERNDSVPERVT